MKKHPVPYRVRCTKCHRADGIGPIDAKPGEQFGDGGEVIAVDVDDARGAVGRVDDQRVLGVAR
jgi:hypothetical protein